MYVLNADTPLYRMAILIHAALTRDDVMNSTKQVRGFLRSSTALIKLTFGKDVAEKVRLLSGNELSPNAIYGILTEAQITDDKALEIAGTIIVQMGWVINGNNTHST